MICFLSLDALKSRSVSSVNLERILKTNRAYGERNSEILGWAGTCLSVIMYVSYVPNIMANLDGNKVPFLQPLAAAINCTIWVSYAFKVQKGLSARRGEFPGDHLWATNRNNGALNRAFSGLINFKTVRAAFKSAEFK
ncbi:hypothetical protein [uncultured Campylobacter sp.]|uniref:hypothetical protein n=1 Tax=uncultured Campylobacter sp. TaxID=218934 RepID=UPI002616D933|nr:hypothetical protein [uncultured Campylobacter sp.]